MPRVFKSSGDGKIPAEAADIAAYLASDGAVPPISQGSPGAADEGARLFANLGCVGCHK